MIVTGPTVLVIDDDATARATLLRHISSWGFCCVEATSCESGLSLAFAQHPDIIVLTIASDRPASDITGFLALTTLRTNEALSSTPIIALLGAESIEDQVRAIDLGADDFVIRPVVPAIFQARLVSLWARRKLREELDETRRRYTAMLVHDLRSPLSMVSGYAELLLDDLDNADRTFLRDGLQHIRTGCERAVSLLSRVLDIAVLEQSYARLEIAPTDLLSLLFGVCAEYQPLAQRKGVVLEVHSSARPVTANVDKDRISQAMGNLVTNALAVTPSGGHVVLEVERDQVEGLLLSVEDTGPGISSEGQVEIFRPWRQSGRSPAAWRSYGLGLAVTRLIAEAHGGRMGLSSDLGVGSKFTILLPSSCLSTST